MKTIVAILFLSLSAVSFADVNDPNLELGINQADMGADICQSEQGKQLSLKDKDKGQGGSGANGL